MMLLALLFSFANAWATPERSGRILSEAKLLAALHGEREASEDLWSKWVSLTETSPAHPDLYGYLALPEARRKELRAKEPGLARIVDVIRPERRLKLDQAMTRIRKELRDRVRADPDALREAIRESVKGVGPLDEGTLDQFLGLEDVKSAGPGEPKWKLVVRVFRNVSPEPGAVFFDLSSGGGRISLYGASCFPATRFRAFRPSAPREALLSNDEAITGDVLKTDLADGRFFLLFNPLPSDTLTQVSERLRLIASQKHKLSLACLGPSIPDCEKLSWLKGIPDNEHLRDLKIFEPR
jgi:hypothetical protein